MRLARVVAPSAAGRERKDPRCSVISKGICKNCRHVHARNAIRQRRCERLWISSHACAIHNGMPVHTMIVIRMRGVTLPDARPLWPKNPANSPARACKEIRQLSPRGRGTSAGSPVSPLWHQYGSTPGDVLGQRGLRLNSLEFRRDIPWLCYPSRELRSVRCIIRRETYAWPCGMTAPAHTSEVDRTSAGQRLYGGEILADVVTVGVVSTFDCRLS